MERLETTMLPPYVPTQTLGYHRCLWIESYSYMPVPHLCIYMCVYTIYNMYIYIQIHTTICKYVYIYIYICRQLYLHMHRDTNKLNGRCMRRLCKICRVHVPAEVPSQMQKIAEPIGIVHYRVDPKVPQANISTE